MTSLSIRVAGAALVSVVLAGTAVPALAVDAPPPGGTRPGRGQAPLPAEIVDQEVQAGVDALVAAGATGVTALVDDGNTVRTASGGVTRLDTRRPMRPATATRVGSITKTFVATVVLQLVGEGRLGLADSVESHLPGRVPGGTEITVRQLLNHTSGLFDYTTDPTWKATATADPTRTWTPAELVDVAVTHEPVFAPGTSWSYCNTNYVLLGMIIERVTGATVKELIDQRIVRPLRLRSTFLATDSHVPGWQAHGYLFPVVAGGEYIDTTSWSPTIAGAAGALVSTTADLSRFFRALLSGRLLRPAELTELTTTVPAGSDRYGLGIISQTLPCGTVWGHTGSIPGYLSLAVTDREGRRSAVLLMATEQNATTSPLFALTAQTAICRMLGGSGSGSGVGAAAGSGDASVRRGPTGGGLTGLPGITLDDVIRVPS